MAKPSGYSLSTSAAVAVAVVAAMVISPISAEFAAVVVALPLFSQKRMTVAAVLLAGFALILARCT